MPLVQVGDPYFKPTAGGYFAHRSGDCDIHGVNVPFWGWHERHREYKPRDLYCVECTLLLEEMGKIVEDCGA